ncbi:sodium- and chloride-dependent glycine transporter 2-like [Haliotis asinina]|uniref:sodium- and chloride-dependent glycine transporter 2-like n=1 Tax=Haliotis asinina TaxID=109174 RepID=UPI003531F131
MTPERWRHHLDYLITLLGGSIGSGSLIKFPYLCMRNGGGAFLIPYAIFTFLGAIPCVFLEMVIGQLSQSGPINVWNLCPSFKGIGFGIATVMWLYVTYYMAIFAWFMYYFYHSFIGKLPWASCDNSWNTPACIRNNNSSILNSTSANGTNITAGAINATTTDNVTNVTVPVTGMTAGEEFWKFQALQMTEGLEHLGGIRWPLVGLMALTGVIMFLVTFQGIRVSGKVVYVTVGVPIILIFVFLIQGCLLPGSADGIYFYVHPKLEKLLEPGMWIEACSLSLYSLNIAMGNIITMAGHNRVTNNCFRDALIVSIADMFSLIVVGFAFFAIIGHVAYLRGVPMHYVYISGFSLAFIIYPEVLTYLPLPHVWSALTFLALMTLEVDSMLPGLEIILAAVEDLFRGLAKRRWAVISTILLSNFLFALPCTTQGGIYIVTLVDWYTYFPAVAVFAMLECVAVSWCYGLERLNRDIRAMWGKTVPQAMMLSIKYVCPLLLLAIFSYSIYSYRPPKYGDYDFPAWAAGVGWLISSISIIQFPIIFIWTVYHAQGSTLKKKLRTSLLPSVQWQLRTERHGNHLQPTEAMEN